ncbi:flagellar capping protein [Clostridium chromiireducens]|uniref:Flagellar hook-associated protein 2 n=1 Tax=Clostridium chromiireducens TaxID=225345 RepID=A0A399IUP1_9CLOT|nr:flagellar filament capping protein FliD [Clostridium chromiireducens]RII36197.1 flagellar capping protein [Clostridium chromiireducens]
MSTVSSTSSSTNVLRITGMATGLDVDSMVEKLMAAEKTKVDKVKQEQQIIEWKQEAYQDIIKDIKDLQSSFYDVTSSDKNILSSSNFAGFNVTGGNNAVANITAGTGAKVGNYTVKVTALASGAGISNTLSGKALSTKLTDIDTLDNTDLTGSITLNLKVNGGSDVIPITLDNSSGDKTIGDLVTAINSQGSGNVKASFSELTGKFSLTTTTTGNTASLTIDSGTSTDLSKVIGFDPAGPFPWSVTNSSSGAVIGSATAVKSANADVTITPPGETVGIPVTNQTTNVFTIDGMNYNLSGVGTSTITVGADNDKVYDKIKGFIDKYNAIVDKIQTKLTEKKNLSYKPLTDTQKEAMKDTEITNWETKAKQGILRDDDNLKKMLNDLRSAFTTPVDGTSFSMVKYGSNSIGLDFGSDRTKPQHIDITDSSKLKAAIATKGDEILKFFTNVSTSSDATTANSENGILTRIKSVLENNVGKTGISYNNAVLTKYANKQDDFSINGTSGSNTLPNQIYQKQQLIDTLNKSLSKKQESYYQKFAKLESAMNTLNSQQASLSQLSGS